MIILGIESSCDDTSVALIEYKNNSISILSETTASQIDVHKKYGGVIPEIAGRMHAEKIVPLIEHTLKDQNTPNRIAVTAGPGLMTGLLVGVEAAKTLSYLKNIPLFPTNHIEGHIYSVYLEEKNDIAFPALCLVVSGGHTEFILMKNHGEYKKIGGTRDDAAGECFDKIAKMLDLPYPGGPKISELAKNGNSQAIPFPKPMINDDNLDMSFSGLKTAALYWLRDNTLTSKEDFCASIEQAIIDVLIAKTKKAISIHNPTSIVVAGGVSANTHLREALKKQNIPVLFPPTKYCMDNATMIATAAIFKKESQSVNWKNVRANPQWKIYQNE